MKTTTVPPNFLLESSEDSLYTTYYPSFVFSELLYEGEMSPDEDPADHYRPVKGVRIA